jgi:hypothetical protein
VSNELDTVVDAEIVDSSAPLSVTDAKRLDKKIRLIVGNISDNLDKLAALLAEAEAGQLHVAFGSPSLSAYLADVMKAHWQDRDERRKIVALLSAKGWSQRAIAPVVGVSQKTVDRDLDEVSHDDSVDVEVISLDGKRRPKHPKPKPAAKVDEMSSDDAPEPDTAYRSVDLQYLLELSDEILEKATDWRETHTYTGVPDEIERIQRIGRTLTETQLVIVTFIAEPEAADTA